MRIHELAKELGISNKDLLSKLKERGLEVKSVSSSVNAETAEALQAEFKFLKSKKESEEAVKSGVRAAKVNSVTPELTGDPEAKKATVEERKKPLLEVPQGVTVKNFAAKINHSPAELIKLLLSLGEIVTITQSLSDEAIHVLADEFGYEVHVTGEEERGEGEEEEKEEVRVAVKAEDLVPRPPVVTVMGHVNHGKTLLLDAIRKTDVVSSEAGGITQHIGAYQVTRNEKKITFIDTPGHEAFTAMRARGAKVTDIAVLVVAADDGVMPQTIEAINHARAAKVPIIVAINKIDKPDANPERVKKELVEQGLVPEEWGGDSVFCEVSAKEKTNIEELLEMIQLVADIQELKANEKVHARGTIVEAKLDKGRGPIATALIQQGVLKIGQAIVAGTSYGRVRAMIDDKGSNAYKAFPAQPMEILGLSSVPQAGDIVEVVRDERGAKEIANKRLLAKRKKEMGRRHVTLDTLYEHIKEGEIRELNLIVKADVQGSLEALRESLAKIDQKEVRINIVHEGVGGISETDVMLAAASNAIIVGFSVRPDTKAKEMATKEQVDMRLYDVIYRVIEDIEAARKGMLAPVITEVELGRANVIALFKISRLGTVAGCMVEDGEIRKSAQLRVVREGVVIHTGKIESLRRFKEDVNVVSVGIECGIHIENFNDVKVGDVLEIFTTEEKPRE